MNIKVILTGATGMVGEGVLLACLGNPIKPVFKVFGKILYPVFRLLMPGQVLTLSEVGQAMINSVTKGYPKQVLEIKDIKELAKL